MRADLSRLKYVAYNPTVESINLQNTEDKSLSKLCSGIKELSKQKSYFSNKLE